MRSIAVLLLAATASMANAQLQRGRTLTSWDCCKPACAWSSIANRSGASGQAMICDKDDNPISTSRADRTDSSCADNPGNGYLCSDYSPRPVSDDMAYGFAITKSSDNCCKCFRLRWIDGPAQGKSMEVQVINSGGSVEDGVRDFILLTPGGGVGPNPKGCESQFGFDWGRQYGGVTRREDCSVLPDNLQGGCYWRWNWAQGDVNDWNIEYEQIQCPDALSGVSGCSA